MRENLQWITDDLARSGLTPDDFPVTPLKSEGELTRRLGFSKMGDTSILDVGGYWIQYPNTEFYRLKLKEPIGDAKYLSPKDAGNHAYIPPAVLAAAHGYKPDAPLFITEGEKKAAKATLEGFPCVGLTGVFGFVDKEAGFLPELDELNFKHRAVYIVYDSDIIGKTLVRQAELRLGVELMNRGAQVLSVRLPSEPDGEKNGLDDFLVSYGKEALERLIEAAKPVFETQITEDTPTDMILKEGSGLASPLEREKLLKLISRHQNVPVDVVREEALKYFPKKPDEAKQGSGAALAFENPEPWPGTVNGSDLLDSFAEKLRAHVSMDTHALTVCALWALLTWVYDSFDILPLLVIRSPEKGCGKTTLLDVLSRLVARPLPASSITASGIFRTIEFAKPCLLVDEVDSFMKDNEELRGVINSGHTRIGAQVVRLVGSEFLPQTFSTYCPKVLSGIGRLPGTIEDRAFVIELARLSPKETVERLRYKDSWPDLGRMAARWAKDNAQILSEDYTEPPEWLSNRPADNWGTLFTIASAAGREWTKRVEAAAKHYAASIGDANSFGVELLKDIKHLFENADTNRFTTAQLVEQLTSLQESPWADWRRGNSITTRQLSGILKPFGIKSKKLRIKDKTYNGYTIEQFSDVFDRYLPIPPSLSGTPEQVNNDGRLDNILSGTQGDNVPDENERNSPESLECSTVPDRTPPIEENGEPRQHDTEEPELNLPPQYRAIIKCDSHTFKVTEMREDGTASMFLVSRGDSDWEEVAREYTRQ